MRGNAEISLLAIIITLIMANATDAQPREDRSYLPPQATRRHEGGVKPHASLKHRRKVRFKAARRRRHVPRYDDSPDEVFFFPGVLLHLFD
jgi:hypothetical protein